MMLDQKETNQKVDWMVMEMVNLVGNPIVLVEKKVPLVSPCMVLVFLLLFGLEFHDFA